MREMFSNEFGEEFSAKLKECCDASKLISGNPSGLFRLVAEEFFKKSIVTDKDIFEVSSKIYSLICSFKSEMEIILGPHFKFFNEKTSLSGLLEMALENSAKGIGKIKMSVLSSGSLLERMLNNILSKQQDARCITAEEAKALAQKELIEEEMQSVDKLIRKAIAEKVGHVSYKAKNRAEADRVMAALTEKKYTTYINEISLEIVIGW